MLKRLTYTRMALIAAVLLLLVAAFTPTSIYLTVNAASSDSTDDLEEEQTSEDSDKVEYTVNYSLTGMSARAHEFAETETDYTVEFVLMSGYTMPQEINVAVDGETLDASQYEYDAKEGTLLLPAASVTGEISITAVGIAEVTGNRIINLIIYIGMILCLAVGASSLYLILTSKKYKGKY